MNARKMALGGVTAALAVVVMCLGGLIPFATYVCPAVCCLLLSWNLPALGARNGWAWYGAVSLLCVLLGPDKEAAAVFVFLGYYPIIKPKLDKMPLSLLWKLLLFNVSTLLMYAALIFLMGMGELSESFREAGMILTVVTLLLGNVTFLMLDRLLGMMRKKFKKR